MGTSKTQCSQGWRGEILERMRSEKKRAKEQRKASEARPQKNEKMPIRLKGLKLMRS